MESGKPPHPRLLNLLRLGAYQLLLLSKIPPHAAVNEMVELAKSEFPGGQVKFVNAVLRQIGRTGAPPLPDAARNPVEHLAVRYSFPEWLVRRWLGRWGAEAAEAMLAAANEAPPLEARVNRLQLSREEARQRLRAQGVESDPLDAPSALLLRAAGDPAQLTGFAEGWLYFQDQSSQFVGFIADPPAGSLCLDLCSAPGGKTTHLAELMAGRGQVLAYDSNRSKLARVRANADRLGLDSIKVLSAPPSGPTADRVLVDAPCSGLGTLRRHAEGRWRVAEADLPRLARTQAGLLAQGAAAVKPGGHVIYSTCTTEPEENEDIVRAFLDAHPDFELRPGPGSDGVPAARWWDGDGFFRTFPNRLEGDGIFAARMVKK